MSRPNGPTMQPGNAAVRPPRPLAQQQGMAQAQVPQQPMAQGVYQGAPDPYPQPAYQNHQSPNGGRQQPPQQYAAPQYDPYAQHQAPIQPYPAAHQHYESQGAPQAPSYSQSSAQTDYTHLQIGTDARAMQHGANYDTWRNAPPAQDPRGYDLGGYATPPPAAHVGHESAAQRYQAAAAQVSLEHSQAPEWVPQHGAQSYSQQSFEPSLGTQGYQPESQYAPEGGEQQGYEEEGEYEYEEAPRGRGLKIAAALVGAVIIGGGLAYGYTTIIGPTAGKPPVIKSAAGPSKIKPSEPGGKQFANTDSKIMGRLGDNTGSEPDVTGAKKVTTLAVGPDGSISPPAATAAQSDDTAFPSSGMTLAASPKADMAPVPAQTQTPAAAPVVVTPPVPEKPVAVAAATPPPAPALDAAPAAPTTTQSISEEPPAAKTPPPAPAPQKTTTAAVAPAPKKPSVTTAAATSAPAAAAVPSVTGAGYVAVLASVPASSTSRMTALKQFADMQQKYGTVLQNKTPDVKEANLGEKGTYHRLLAGPPGSRDSANQVCAQLKSAGYAESCWVTAY